MAAAFRAFFFYLFLVLVTRIVGRRPGKQLTPFEFVLVFFMGGLALTAIVGSEASLTNAFCAILAVALGHYAIVWVRSRSSRIARIIDGTPLYLLEGGQWRTESMSKTGIQDDDVMASARDQGVPTLEKIEIATLERNGEIAIIPAK